MFHYTHYPYYDLLFTLSSILCAVEYTRNNMVASIIAGCLMIVGYIGIFLSTYNEELEVKKLQKRLADVEHFTKIEEEDEE